MLLLGDGLRLEQLVGTALLRAGVGQAGLSHFQISLCLGHGVARNSGIHPDHQSPALHHLPGLDGEIEDFTGGLRFHFDRGVRLHGARRLRRHDDVATFHRNRLVGDGRFFLLAA